MQDCELMLEPTVPAPPRVLRPAQQQARPNARPRALPRVLLVCRDASRLAWLRHALARDYEVRETDDPGLAIEIIAAGAPRLVLVELDLGTASGLRLLRQLPRRGKGRPPVVALGDRGDVRLAVARTHDLADMLLTHPASEVRLLRGVRRLLDRETEKGWDELPAAQRLFLRSTLDGFNDLASGCVAHRRVSWHTVRACAGAVLEAAGADVAVATLKQLQGYHHQAFVHAMRVATSMVMFGAEIGLRQGDLAVLAQAGLVHDVSVNLLPAEVVDKPGRLDAAEWRMIRGHPLVSKRLLESSDGIPAPVVGVALNHHERLDGSGYPNGLKGAQIDDLSMICAIADIYMALTSHRAHRPALGSREALRVLVDQGGRALDPSFLRRFEDVVAHVEGW